MELIRAFTPVFAGYAKRCAAEPGSFRTREFGTVPGLQRITEEVLRCARDKGAPSNLPIAVQDPRELRAHRRRQVRAGERIGHVGGQEADL